MWKSVCEMIEKPAQKIETAALPIEQVRNCRISKARLSQSQGTLSKGLGTFPKSVREEKSVWRRRTVQGTLSKCLGTFPKSVWEKGSVWRRKTVQASREDVFPLLAGAKAPDPYAACGRKIHSLGAQRRRTLEKKKIC